MGNGECEEIEEEEDEIEVVYTITYTKDVDGNSMRIGHGIDINDDGSGYNCSWLHGQMNGFCDFFYGTEFRSMYQVRTSPEGVLQGVGIGTNYNLNLQSG